MEGDNQLQLLENSIHRLRLELTILNDFVNRIITRNRRSIASEFDFGILIEMHQMMEDLFSNIEELLRPLSDEGLVDLIYELVESDED